MARRIFVLALFSAGPHDSNRIAFPWVPTPQMAFLSSCLRMALDKQQRKDFTELPCAAPHQVDAQTKGASAAGHGNTG